MTKIRAGAVLFLLMAGMAFAQQQSAMASKPDMHTGSGNVEQQLKDMEDKWTKASLASDGSMLAPLLSDDFVNINSDGTMMDKEKTVSRTSKGKIEKSELSEVAVNAHGDSAIVTGIWTGKGVDGEGKAFDGKERWADTWVKKDGKWVCVASASAAIK